MDQPARPAVSPRCDVVIIDVTPADDSGSRLDGHRFIAKADLRAERIEAVAHRPDLG